MSQPPTITQQSPKDYIVDPRENIVIQCEAKGKPPPRLVVTYFDYYACTPTSVIYIAGRKWHVFDYSYP